jgi:ABC-2 type transport system permease protein
MLGVAMSVLGLASGAFFPLTLLPLWLQRVAEANPIAIVMEGTRGALIGGSSEDLTASLLVLVLLSALALAAGVWAFRAALAREHRRGTLGLY